MVILLLTFIKCCEQLQKLRVRLGTCKIYLTPPPPPPPTTTPVMLHYCPFKDDIPVVILIVQCLDVAFLQFETYVHFHIFI